MKKNFIGNCVSLPARLITEMKDSGREIQYSTFARHINTSMLNEFGNSPKVKDDWHVKFYSGKYSGKKCVYMVHSAFEYVFV